jgi:hypothetical protein
MSRLERWAPWWGLLLVPSAFLGLQSAAYAMVPYACRSDHQALIHVAPAIQVAISVIGVLLSGATVLRARTAHAAHVPPERRFLNAVSLATAILFLVATLVQWYVAIALSPCLS